MSEGALRVIQGQQSQPVTDEALWDAKQTATFLKMSVHWVYRTAERGELPYRKLGASLRFVPAEIRAWLGQGKVA